MFVIVVVGCVCCYMLLGVVVGACLLLLVCVWFYCDMCVRVV